MFMRIGLIDSGIGGLTVLSSLLKHCPNHEYIYFGDTLHLPYGEKKKEEIICYGNNIIKFFEKENVDLIIIACGTLSSHKDELISKKKIIDIISPLNNKLNDYKKISIIATPLSIKTNAFKKYISTDLNLISCPKLVPIIESNNYELLDIVLEEYLKETQDSDALILGCTHYPIIVEYIKKHFDKNVICMDQYIIPIISSLEESKNELKIYFSKIDKTLLSNVERILNMKDIDIERVIL